MPEPKESKAISFRSFLEGTSPGTFAEISDLGGTKMYPASGGTIASMRTPEISLHCDSDSCSGIRLYSSDVEMELSPKRPDNLFLSYVCKNCTSNPKFFALHVQLSNDFVKGVVYKFGEFPPFGPPMPARLITLIGPQKDLFLKGRRAENQGLGIAAFAYYRRVVEDQKNRIFNEIIKVCKRLSVDQSIIDELSAAKVETQFSKAVDSVKHAIPQALLVSGHNPLTLLHSALSEGLHADTDEECLEIATSIREVMADFAERMGEALKDEAKLNSAVSRLLQKKRLGNSPSGSTKPTGNQVTLATPKRI